MSCDREETLSEGAMAATITPAAAAGKAGRVTTLALVGWEMKQLRSMCVDTVLYNVKCGDEGNMEKEEE
jgi:hypothetical protein